MSDLTRENNPVHIFKLDSFKDSIFSNMMDWIIQRLRATKIARLSVFLKKFLMHWKTDKVVRNYQA